MHSPLKARSSASLLHGLFLAVSMALISPALSSMETPLAEGIYRAERGYKTARDSCPLRMEIAEVAIARGAIRFESGGAIWSGTINEKSGVVRIEAAGIEPRPTSDLHIRGHYTKAQLFSAICGVGYFRILR